MTDSLAAIVAELRAWHGSYSSSGDELLAIIGRLEALSRSGGVDGFEQLRAFANDVLEDFWEGGLDGCDLQELGEKHKLLIPTIVDGPCGEEDIDGDYPSCSCAHNGADFPAECYRYAPILTAPPQAGEGMGEK